MKAALPGPEPAQSFERVEQVPSFYNAELRVEQLAPPSGEASEQVAQRDRPSSSPAANNQSNAVDEDEIERLAELARDAQGKPRS